MAEKKNYKVGALCAGYGGIELGLSEVVNTELVWVSDIDTDDVLRDAPNRILEKRFGKPNLGDLTKITSPPKVDIVTAGFPCQPVSVAGGRKGIEDERWLIEDVCRIADDAGAEWLILENVPGIYTANNGHAFARVCAAMAYYGFIRWQLGTFRASDIGAPHRRLRWFCVATNTDGTGLQRRRTQREFKEIDKLSFNQQPYAKISAMVGEEGSSSKTIDDYLPEIIEYQQRLDFETESGEKWVWETEDDDWEKVHWADGSGYIFKPTSKAFRIRESDGSALLPTPTARDYKDAGPNVKYKRIAEHRVLPGVIMHEVYEHGWGEYEEALKRWEEILGRRAPDPAPEYGYLSHHFVEWMMGLPEGHVCGDDLGLSRSIALKCLGNGVVPQQAKFAIEILLDRIGSKSIDAKANEMKKLRSQGMNWQEIAETYGYKDASGPRKLVQSRTS